MKHNPAWHSILSSFFHDHCPQKPMVFKSLVIAINLLFASCQVLAIPLRIAPEITSVSCALLNNEPSHPLNKLYYKLNHPPTTNLTTRITTISATFLKTPYQLGALGEGRHAPYDQTPLYRTDAFDCETYVDTVLALALASNVNQFKQCINHIRYREGRVSFINRNHFTCLDWNQNNQRQGFLKDITTTLKDKRHQSVALIARANIDKAAWYNHLSIAAIRIHDASPLEKTKRLAALKHEGHAIPITQSIIPYIPLSALFDHHGKPNQFLFDQLPNAAIIEIVRPNWDLEHAIGTHLNVSHLGFVIRKNKSLVFRNASSLTHQVSDVSLIAYLREALNSPTIKGINVQIVQPQAHQPCA